MLTPRGSRIFILAATLACCTATAALGEDSIVIGGVFVQDVEEDSAYLGVRLKEETGNAEGGARVTHVVSGSPAEKSGIEEGDIVVAFDGEVIRGPVALTQKIHGREPGEEVSITVLREGREEKLSVTLADRRTQLGLFDLADDGSTAYVYGFGDRGSWNETQAELRKRMEELGERLGEKYADPEYWKQLVPDAGDPYRFYSAPQIYSTWGKPKLGVQLVETTPELREHLGAPKDAGVLVSKVLAGTPAERSGVKVGDLILAVAGEPVASSGDLVEALADRVGETFAIDVVRDGRTISIEVTIPDPASDRPTGPRA